MNELLRRMLFLPRQASTLAPQIDALHYAVILTTLAGSALVGLVAVAYVIRYRHRPATPIPRLIRRRSAPRAGSRSPAPRCCCSCSWCSGWSAFASS